MDWLICEILSVLKHLSYTDRSKACDITTVHYRRIRDDMIETYKIVTEKYEEDLWASESLATYMALYKFVLIN